VIVFSVEFLKQLAIIRLQIGTETSPLYWHGTRAQLVVTDPQMVKEIFNSSEDAFSKGGGSRKYIRKLFVDGPVFSRG
jgi:PHYB activation tagged suppressor 1